MNADWLARLAPAHAPPPPGWWPPAPGWWGLALLLLLGIAALAYRLSRPQLRLRRAALRELSRLEQIGLDDGHLARRLEDLLRRYAVARFGREAVARLAGAAWIDFVVARGGAGWAGSSGAALLRAAYGGAAGGQTGGARALWLAGARAFIRGRT
jgi:hypothetical protein